MEEDLTPEQWETIRAKRKDWLAMPPENTGIVTHDVHKETDR